MIVKNLYELKKITPPKWLINSLIMEIRGGSYSYGCQDLGSSDNDIYGICIPPREIVFPYFYGYIQGFGTPPPKFEQYQQQHIVGEYDITIYNIVKFFHLCFNNNPNIVDILFSPNHCFSFLSPVGKCLIDNKHLFLSKKCIVTFKGYAVSQLRKLKNTNKQSLKRQHLINLHGFDTKFAYHVVRLGLECGQILKTGNLILDLDKDIYRDIRNGKWTLQDIYEFFSEQEEILDNLYKKSELPEIPDEKKLKKLLMECMEEFWNQ